MRGVAAEVRATGSRAGAIGLLVAGGLFATLWAVSDTPQVALFLSPIVPVCIRLAAVRVRTTGDRLVVRNFLRTHDLHREEIERFVVEDYVSGGPQSRSRTVYAHLRNGRWVSLAATSFGYWKFLVYWPRRNARNEADDICAALDGWLHAGP
jgi:hypothetical protein